MLCSVRSPPPKTLNPRAMMTSRLFSVRLLHPALPLYRVLAAASVSRRARAFSVRPSAGQPKSLVDEEAELSDWVTGIKMESSFRPGMDNGGRRQRDRRRSDSDEDFGSPFDRRNMKGRGQKRSFLGSDSNDSEEESYGGGRGKRGGRGGGSLGPRDGGRRGGKLGTERRTVRDGWKGTGTFSRSMEEVGNVDPRFASGRKGGRRFEMGRKRAGFESTGEDEDEDDDFGFAREVGGGRGRRFDMTHRKGFDKKGVSFESTEEDEDEAAGGRGRRFDTRQRKGLHKGGVSFESTEEDAEDGLVGEGEREFEGNNGVRLQSSYNEAMAGRSLEKKEGGLDGKHDSYLSNSRFDECSLSPLSLKGVKASGYERMTVVQEATLPVILRGKDVLAKARTGTGKTVAFLLPAIEIVAKQPPIDRDQRRPPIYVLVICPTRELANQAAMEAGKLLKFHPYIGAQCVTGGTRIALEQKRMQANPCQILVATPGRLRDHIENTAGFATRLRGVQVLVLDEADHLLDMGFRKDIEKIIAAVPKQRQTLLFSATVPEEVRQICHIALRRDHEYINTVEEGSEDTHSQVRQNFLIVPLEKQFSMLYRLLADHVADDIDYKVLVFCTTAMVTRLVAGFLSEMKLKVREIHSRKSQSYRAKVSDEFRKSKGLILVTSDVSARGVDYPDVTLVIQVGIPSDREQYIHRLGRTGRTGKEGQGILMLAPWEEYFLSVIRDLPINEFRSPSVDPDTTRKVQHALAYVEMKDKESAYQAWLGYYNSNKTIGRDKSRLVLLANEFSRSMGLEKPPVLRKVVLGKMGLRNVPGLRSM